MKSTKYNVVLVGDAGVGKSALVKRLIDQTFVDEYDPTIEDTYNKETPIGGQVCSLNIVDTAGQEEYSGIRDQSIRSGDGLLLVFAIDNAESFDKISSLIDEMKVIKRDADVPLVLIGNKCDLSLPNGSAVEMTVVQEWAKSNGIPLVETSAKSGMGVDTAFRELVREIRECRRRARREMSSCCRFM